MKRTFFLILLVVCFCVPAFAETRTPVLIAHSLTAHSGDLLQTETDLKIPGRGLDYEFTRTYRSRITFNGPLGWNWDHNYNKRLILREDGNVARFDGNARFDIYILDKEALRLAPSGQAQGERYISPSGYFDTLLVAKDEAGQMIGATITDKHGTVNTYGADGFISQIADRNGNKTSDGVK